MPLNDWHTSRVNILYTTKVSRTQIYLTLTVRNFFFEKEHQQFITIKKKTKERKCDPDSTVESCVEYYQCRSMWNILVRLKVIIDTASEGHILKKL